MATLEKIRKHSVLLLIIIGGALVAFILGDFLTGNRGPSQEPVAEIFGEKINYRDFDAKVEQQRSLVAQQNPDYKLTGADLFQIQNNSYDQMVKKIILDKEYSELGLAVSKAELAELFYGKYAHSYVRNLFTDPETGVFDPAKVQMYIEAIDEQSVEAQQQWKMIEDAVYEERYNSKYTNLVNKAFYIPKAFIERDNVEKNKKFTTEYVGLKFNTINDSTITVSDEELKKYYDEHAYEYVYDSKTASLEFVVFDINPSEKDFNEVKSVIDEAYIEMAEVSNENMTNFIFSKSDIDYNWDSTYVNRKKMPTRADTLFDAPIGTLLPPYIENNVFYIHKLMDKKALPDSLKAAHILIAYKGALRASDSIARTKEEAKAIADSLLLVVNKMDSASFANTASQVSDDMSAKQNGGFLGWFTEGTMVAPFNKACIENAVGSYTIAETDFGFHIIKVMDKTAPQQKVKLATIHRTIEPSRETADSIYGIASTFASGSNCYENFDKNITNNNYNKHIAQNVKTTDYSIQGIEEGREIVRWVFDEKNEDGAISPVFDLAGEYKNVVVYIKKRNEKGQAKFEDVKEYLEPLVKKEKKAETLTKKMNEALTGVSSIAALSNKLQIQVDTFDITFASYNMPGYGPELRTIATICNQPTNKLSKPIKGETAIFVANVSKVTEAAPANIEQIKAQKNSFFQQKVSYLLFKSLEDVANITDNRILFY